MSIRKRKWETKNGKGEAYIATIGTRDRDDNGRIVRVTKMFRTLAEAKAWVAEATVEVKAGKFVPPSKSPTVAEAGKLWLARVEANGRERSTIDAYRQELELHIMPVLGDMKLSDLSTPVVESFRDKLSKSVNPRTGKKLTQAMLRKVLGALKTLLNDATRRGLVTYNAAAPTQIESNGRGKRKLKDGVDFPTVQECGRIIAAAPEGKARALLMVAAFAGLRGSELRGLRWGDVNLDKRTITIEQRADRFGKIGSPKSESGHRTIPIYPILVNTLRNLRGDAKDTALVFGTLKGKPDDHSNIVTRIFRPAQIAAGITRAVLDADGKPVMDKVEAKYTGLHVLRHFAASFMLHRKEHGGLGLDLREAQARLGHATLAMTADTYGHLFEVEDDSEVGAAAERQLFAVVG